MQTCKTQEHHTFHIRAGRGPHALPRVLLLFARRRLSADALRVDAINDRLADVSLSCRCAPAEAEQLVAQLRRLVEIERATATPVSRSVP